MGEEVEELVAKLRAGGNETDWRAADTIESLRATLTRVEEERDEAVKALEPFAKARPTETGFDPADGDALLSTRHHNPIGLHEWVIARDLHARLSRATPTEKERSE